jgi:hypothetical protein
MALKEWLDDNFQKGFIRPLSSPAASPISFIKMEEGLLKPYIYYQKCNQETIKD